MAEARGERPLIVSARYGLLLPTSMIEPYDETLHGQSLAMRQTWSRWVLEAITRMWRPGEMAFTSYLGHDYAEFLIPALRAMGYSVEEPVRGLSQGQRLAWFKRTGMWDTAS